MYFCRLQVTAKLLLLLLFCIHNIERNYLLNYHILYYLTMILSFMWNYCFQFTTKFFFVVRYYSIEKKERKIEKENKKSRNDGNRCWACTQLLNHLSITLIHTATHVWILIWEATCIFVHSSSPVEIKQKRPAPTRHRRRQKRKRKLNNFTKTFA